MNPYLYFKFPYQSYPYASLPFPFLYSRLMCFVTLLSQHNYVFSHRIVSSAVWRNVYKDSVHPLVKQGNMYSSKFRSVQFSQVKFSISGTSQYSFTYPLTRKKRNFSFFSCRQSILLSPLFNKDKAQLSPIHPVPSHPHIHPLSIPFSLFIHLINSCIVARERAR